jgi:hypothetical protein
MIAIDRRRATDRDGENSYLVLLFVAVRLLVLCLFI